MGAKKIGEVFSDYKTNSNIKYAQIVALNVLKKTNTLEVIIYYDEYIEIKEIWYFEKFLQERFHFSNIDMKIKYHDAVEKKSVTLEWKNIIAYMAHKYPLMKPMLLLKSDVEVEENNILVRMHIKGADFLRAKKTDKELVKVLENIFGEKYNIELREELSKEEMKRIKQKLEEEEAAIVAHIEEENKKNEEVLEVPVPEYVDPDYQMPSDEDYVPENLDIEVEAVNVEYIMGKPSKAKEKHLEIKDLGADAGRVTLEGRAVTSNVRETKSGKGMLIFDIYDGTGRITIKSFAKDLKTGQEMTEKIDNAKAIKVIGKAGLDTYAGDVTVIANTIIATESEFPEMPEEDENTPLILGSSMNITEPLVKVSDLGVDDGKISLQGEVIYSEDRTLKSGKTLFSFDLYDGTSTITCKAFLEKDQAKKKMKRSFVSLLTIAAISMSLISCNNAKKENATPEQQMEQEAVIAGEVSKNLLTAELKDEVTRFLKDMPDSDLPYKLSTGEVEISVANTDFMLPTSKANELNTPAQKARACGIYFADLNMLKAMKKPTTEVESAILKLTTDLNIPFAVEIMKESAPANASQEELNKFFQESYTDGTMQQIAETYGVQAALIEQ